MGANYKAQLTKRTLFSQCIMRSHKLSSGCKNPESATICNDSIIKKNQIKPNLFSEANGLTYLSCKMGW